MQTLTALCCRQLTLLRHHSKTELILIFRTTQEQLKTNHHSRVSGVCEDSSLSSGMSDRRADCPAAGWSRCFCFLNLMKSKSERNEATQPLPLVIKAYKGRMSCQPRGHSCDGFNRLQVNNRMFLISRWNYFYFQPLWSEEGDEWVRLHF